MADEKEDIPESPDIHFEPVVTLKPVEISNLEDSEEEMVKLRAKLFRYDSSVDPPEWKERGTGDVKILKHKINQTCRVLMRRDKTLKVCANHYVLPHMELKPNCGSDRAWVWSTPADLSDDEAKPELLAIRFANSENAQKFLAQFEEAKKIMEKDGDKSSENEANGDKEDSGDKDEKKEESEKKEDKETEDVAKQLEEMSVKDKDKSDSKDSEQAER